MTPNTLYLSGLSFILCMIYSAYRWLVVRQISLVEIFLIVVTSSLVYFSVMAIRNRGRRRSYIERVERGGDEAEVIQL